MHLLTREAWRLYRRLLKPDGWLAVDITNRHIGLTPVIRAHHNAVGHHSLIEVESAAEPQLTIYGAWRLLVASNRALLSRKRVISNSREVDSSGEQVEWTDERASVLPVLHF